jgi:hypothetical protein
MKATIYSFLVTILMITTIPMLANADQPGKHPAYLHALTDLRVARWELQKRSGDAQIKWDEAKAIAEIDACIREIKQAAIDDGKDLNEHPKEDAGKLDRKARLHDALRLLKNAHKDISEKEDNSFAKGLRSRAIGHLNKAINFTEQGISNAEHRN